MTCQHDQKKYGLFGLPKEADGCLACAYEQLVARMNEARTVLDFYGRLANWHSPSTGFVLQYDPEPSPIQSDRGAKARAFLTTADQPTGGDNGGR